MRFTTFVAWLLLELAIVCACTIWEKSSCWRNAKIGLVFLKPFIDLEVFGPNKILASSLFANTMRRDV